MEAYIRDLRSTMEGDKGGTAGTGKYYCGKRTLKQRWKDYKDSRKELGLQVIGSQSLFSHLWKKHEEIRETKAKGHSKCDICGRLQVEKCKYQFNRDEYSIQRLKELHEEEAIHNAQHMGTFFCGHI